MSSPQPKPVAQPSVSNVGVAVFAGTPAQASELGTLLERLGERNVHVQAGGCQAAINWCAGQSAPVLLVDLDGESAPLQKLAELTAQCEPGCNIVALGSDSDVDLYRALLHSGVLDYLLKPVRLDLLASTLERSRSEHKDSFARTGRTIAVTGCAGGLGTSSVVAGIAQLLSNVRHVPVAVVDYDRNKSDQSLLLGAQGSAGLDSVLDSPAIDTRLLQRALLSVNPRLHLMSQASTGTVKPVDTHHLLSLGANLCQMFNQVIWDLPATHCPEAMEILRHSETRIVLTDLSVQGARNTQRLLSLIGDESDGQQLLLVANPVHGTQTSISGAQFEDFIGRRLDLHLPHAGNTLSESLLTGPLSLERLPALRQALLNLADLACGRHPESVQPTGLLDRLKLAIGRRAA